MPEYIAPGVYVEEVSFRAKSIEGVSTSTTAFVGPTRSGPVSSVPELLTSFGEFERSYGGLHDLGCAPSLNTIAHGVRAYFNEGGKRLHVARVAGRSKTAAGINLVPGKTSRFVARFPGAAGNGTIAIQIQTAPASIATAATAVAGSTLRIKSAPPVLLAKRAGAWRNRANAVHAFVAQDEAAGMEFITLQVVATDADGHSEAFGGLGLDPRHPQYIGTVLAKRPAAAAGQVWRQFAFDIARTVRAFDLLPAVAPDTGSSAKTLVLSGGTDVTPTLADYQRALGIVAELPDVSIVAAPGHTEFPAATATGVASALVAHAEQLAYRIAVLDVPANRDVDGAPAYKAAIDSKYAALYYPWIVVAHPSAGPGNPGAPAEITLPPSPFVCGIYARNDIERGVYKAPANMVVRSALRFARPITTEEQEVLNPLGINCLRSFAGKGNLVWGARTTSSDPEWKYVNLRRYFIYLEHSISLGTQWAVFEPNAEPLWAKIRSTLSDFLTNEWRNGALLGSKPEQAYFVKCDHSTMTQNDLDNGRLICLIGVAALKPAEFVIFRIGQWTADAKP